MIGQMTDAMTAQVWPKLEGALRAKVRSRRPGRGAHRVRQTLKAFVIDATKDRRRSMRSISARRIARDGRILSDGDRAKAAAADAAVMAEYFGTLMPRMEGFNRDLQTRIQAILTKHGVK